MNRFHLLPILILVAASSAQAQCDYVRQHAIEAEFAAEVERSGGVTADMREAQGTAYASWDAELNRFYRTLMAGLRNDADRSALREAQLAWLAFHEAESAWLGSDVMYGQAGTSGPLNVAGAALERLQQRVCDLQSAAETVETLGED